MPNTIVLRVASIGAFIPNPPAKGSRTRVPSVARVRDPRTNPLPAHANAIDAPFKFVELGVSYQRASRVEDHDDSMLSWALRRDKIAEGIELEITAKRIDVRNVNIPRALSIGGLVPVRHGRHC
jgi:hypothetical protein